MSNRILFLQPYLAPYRIDVYNYLSQYFELKVLFWYNEAPEQNFNLEILKRKCSFSFGYLENGFIIKDRVIKFDIIKQILKFRPTLIVCHEYGFFTLVSLILQRFLRFKVIINSDDNLDMLQRTKGIRNLLHKICLTVASGIITNNPNSLEYLQSQFPKLKNNSTYYPILQDESHLRQQLSHSLEISRKYIKIHQLQGKKVLLYIGRLAEVKCLDILIDGFNDLAGVLENIILIIVGAGPEEQKLREIVADYKIDNKIIFTGRKDGEELYAWYNIGQIFVLPSKFEPFGAVVNEALISGNFVIVSSKVGSKYLLNTDSGLIFESENVEALKEDLKVALGKIYPISNEIKLKRSKSVHPFLSYTNNLKDFLLNQS